MASPEIATQPVQSSKLAALGYNPDLFILRAVFSPSKATYDYFDVPPEVWSGLKSAPSIGTYFGVHIAGKRGEQPPFEFAKIDTPKADELWAKYAAPTKAIEGVVELPRQAAPVAEKPAEVIVQVELPSDEAGLTARAAEVVQEMAALVIRHGNTIVLASPTPDGYAHVMALIVAKKEEKKRALAEVEKIKGPATRAWQAACAFAKRVEESYDSAIAPLDKAAMQWKRDVQAAEAAQREVERKAEQARLDAENAERARIAQETAKAEADNMRSVGQHEVAAQIEAAPQPTYREIAPTRVAPSVVPQVAGSRVNTVWKFNVERPDLVPRFYMNHIAMALHRAGASIPEDKMGPLIMEIGRAFEEFHSLDETKVGARVRSLKAAAVGLIPGVNVYDDQKTGSTGR